MNEESLSMNDNQFNSPKYEPKYILFLCKKCHSLCMTYPQYFVQMHHSNNILFHNHDFTYSTQFEDDFFLHSQANENDLASNSTEIGNPPNICDDTNMKTLCDDYTENNQIEFNSLDDISNQNEININANSEIIDDNINEPEEILELQGELTDSNSTKHHNIKPDINDNEIFEKGLQIFKKLSKQPYFPLCNTCSDHLIEECSIQAKFYEKSQNFYSRLDIKSKDVFGVLLSEEIAATQNEIRKKQERIEEIQKEVQSMQPEPSPDNSLDKTERSTKEHDDLKRIAQNAIQKRSITTIEAKNEPWLFKSLVFPVVFSIKTKGHFPTINGSRLGQNSIWSISNHELNASLFFLAQLIINTAPAANIRNNSLFLDSEIHVKLDSPIKITSPEKRTRHFSLFPKFTWVPSNMIENNDDESTDDVVLNANLMRNNNHLFNQAIGVLFRISSDIFQSSCIQNASIAPPNFINMSKKCISEKSYCFNMKNYDEWTQAMRLLLCNYKFLFSFALRTGVNHEDEKNMKSYMKSNRFPK